MYRQIHVGGEWRPGGGTLCQKELFCSMLTELLGAKARRAASNKEVTSATETNGE